MVLYYGLFALQTANNIIAGYRPEQRRKSRLISSDNSWIYTEDLKKRYHDSHYILIPVYTDKNNDHWYFIPWTAQRVKSRIDERSIREHFSHSNLSTYWITNEIIPNRSIPRTKRSSENSTIDEQVTNRKSRLTRLRSFFLSIR